MPEDYTTEEAYADMFGVMPEDYAVWLASYGEPEDG